MSSEVHSYERSMRDGSQLHRAGRPELALTRFQHALAVMPDDANAIAACATVLSELELRQAAYRLLASKRDLLAGDADGLINLGIAAELCEELTDSVACFEAALRLASLNPRASVKLCWIHARTGKVDAAISLANALVADKAGDLGRALLLVDLLLSASRFDDACAALSSHLSQPSSIPIPEASRAHLVARQVLCNALAGNLDAARLAVAESPQHIGQVVEAINLIPGLPAPIAHFVRRVESSAADDVDSLLVLCASHSLSTGHWRCEASLTAYLREIIGSATPAYSLKLGWRELRKISMMLPLSIYERAQILALSAEQAEARIAAAKPLARHWFPDIGNTEIRLGIAIDNIDDPHHAAKICRLLRLHDRKRFSLHLYCVTERPAAALYTPFEPLVDRVVEIAHLSAAEAIARIRLDRLDLVIDMTGHTASVLDAALWARVAKVQAGIPAWTENLRATPYDVLLEDTVTQATFVGAEATFDKVSARRAIGLPPDAFVLTSLPAPFALDQGTFSVWLDILERSPATVLLLPVYSDAVHAYWLNAVAERGIDKSRIFFSKALARADDMSVLGLADLYVDTLRIDSSEGLSDALMAGVPAISVSGEIGAAQLSAKVLIGEGLPELVLANTDKLIEAAVGLSTNAESMAALKDTVHRTMSGPRAIRSMARMIEWENALIAAVDAVRAT